MSQQELILKVEGPFSFLEHSVFPSFFDCPLANSKGIYLWTVLIKRSELVYYVGETGRSFGVRMLEHVKGYLSGEYGINDPVEFKKGKRVRIWKGLWRGGPITEFLKRYAERSSQIMDLLKVMRILLIPLDCDQKLRKRIEGTVGQILYSQEGIVGEFQEPDCKFQRPEVDTGPLKLKLSYGKKILGLPSEFIV